MKSQNHITGIQQIGIGVSDPDEAFDWYRKNMGMDIKVFDEKITDDIKLPYTEGEPVEKRAILAFNLQSGGGIEIWRHSVRPPKTKCKEARLGDIGIYIAKMKTIDIDFTYDSFKQKGINLISEVVLTPAGIKEFYMTDPYGNIFQYVEEREYFAKTNFHAGGVYGAVIGVSDIDKSLVIYQNILEYDAIVYDKTGTFEDFKNLEGGDSKFRRVLLKHSKSRTGSFSPMFGPTEIELIQNIDHKGENLYDKDIWGDKGFIHLCFDVIGIKKLNKKVIFNGFPITVDSADSFDLGKAEGHFVYISDPDNIPLEFVETHKIPIIKTLGWYINIKNRNPEKSLPDWIIKMMSLKRVKK